MTRYCQFAQYPLISVDSDVFSDVFRCRRKIEREEEKLAYQDPDKQCYHLCIVNLVIGTLYCAKGNFEFGISRVIKSLEPYNKKLSTDTW